jgi:hypothetical protein
LKLFIEEERTNNTKRVGKVNTIIKGKFKKGRFGISGSIKWDRNGNTNI